MELSSEMGLVSQSESLGTGVRAQKEPGWGSLILQGWGAPLLQKTSIPGVRDRDMLGILKGNDFNGLEHGLLLVS